MLSTPHRQPDEKHDSLRCMFCILQLIDVLGTALVHPITMHVTLSAFTLLQIRKFLLSNCYLIVRRGLAGPCHVCCAVLTSDSK